MVLFAFLQIRTRLLLMPAALECLGSIRFALALGVGAWHNLVRFGGAIMGTAVFGAAFELRLRYSFLRRVVAAAGAAGPQPQQG